MNHENVVGNLNTGIVIKQACRDIVQFTYGIVVRCERPAHSATVIRTNEV